MTLPNSKDQEGKRPSIGLPLDQAECELNDRIALAEEALVYMEADAGKDALITRQHRNTVATVERIRKALVK